MPAAANPFLAALNGAPTSAAKHSAETNSWLQAAKPHGFAACSGSPLPARLQSEMPVPSQCHWHATATSLARIRKLQVLCDQPLKGRILSCVAFLSTAAPCRGILPDPSNSPHQSLFL